MKTFMELMSEESKNKLRLINNPKVEKIIDEYCSLCVPAKITVLNDSKEDIQYIRDLSLKNGEESSLEMKGHSIHFDGFNDQGRDTKNTCILLPKGKKLSSFINTKDRDEGIIEVRDLMKDSMHGKEMLVKFYCLGPVDSNFSILALQITDSAYVCHSENLLYRQGYHSFMKLHNKDKFFYFIHSAGVLENHVTKDIGKRRIFMDLEENRVFTINNQYAGNSVGLKKLALRLAINKSSEEGWLCEHMFIMGVHPVDKNRVTYFMGAYPSACGKTSTAMIPGQSIVGDDIAYIKVDEKGMCRAVNIEKGIFGIIEDVNPIDDPLLYKVLTSPREMIFSNVLIKDKKPYWLGMGSPLPAEGVNFSGEWHVEKKDKDGKNILAAHKNARYTITLNDLENVDNLANDPNGVPIEVVVYGGRDSDTTPPVVECLSWSHGVFVGASLESETTAATLGSTGERVHNPMANLDFLVIPLGLYVENHLKFGDKLDKVPLVFSTNYFLKKDGKFLNEKVDKKVWVLWMEGRVHGEYSSIETPIGAIPEYNDLAALFKQVFNKVYTEEQYIEQFSIRIHNLTSKLDRIEKIFNAEDGVPNVFFDHLKQQRERLLIAKEKFGKNIISPLEFKQ